MRPRRLGTPMSTPGQSQSRPRLEHVYGLRLLRERRTQRIAILAVLAIVLAVRLGQFVVYSTQIQWGYDFSAYWAAAANVLTGNPIYSAEQLAGTYSPQQQYLYLYPPFFAVAMTPFAAVFDDYRVANWVWAGIGALLVVATVRLVDRSERITSGRDGWLLVGAAFAFPPVVGELVMGNVHLLLLALFAGSWAALRRPDAGRSAAILAGVLIGIATLIKIFPAVLILWLVLRRRWTSAFAAVAAMSVLVIATLPVIGLQPWLDYPTVLLNLGAPIDTRDTVAPIVWLSSIVPPAVARLLVVGAGLAIVAGTSQRRSEAVSYAVAVAVSVLIAPALYHHYLAILVLPLLLAIRSAPPIWWIALAYVLMFGGEQVVLGENVWIVNRLLPTLGAVLVLVGLVVRGAARSDRPSTLGAG
jgi:hypothetical protein